MKRKICTIVIAAIATISIIGGMNNLNKKEKREIRNKEFEFNVDPETFEVIVSSEGKKENLSEPLESKKVSNLKESKNSISWTYEEDKIGVEILKKDKYLDIKIKSNKEEENNFAWPFVKGEAYMLPINEGKYIKRDDKLWKEYFNGNEIKVIEGLTMPFFAVDKEEFSLVYIMDNSYNNYLEFETKDNIKLNVRHEYPIINEKREYGFRVYITEKNPVDVAKTYKNYVVEKGNFVTLKEKAKVNKNIKKLYSAPHVYFWERKVISEDNIKWNKFKKEMPEELKVWVQKLLKENCEGGEELGNAFDEMDTEEYVDRYIKNQIIKAFTEVLQLKEFYNEKIFISLDKESQNLIDKGIENLNEVEIIKLNKRLLKSKLLNSVDEVEKWANSNTVDIIKDMKASGIKKMWLGLDDWNLGYLNPNLIEEIKNSGYLIGTYDSYHSIHKPGEEQWNTATFKDTSLYENATVTDKDGNKIEGFNGVGRKLNPTLAMPSVRDRVSSIMNTGLPFNSWFLDTDGTGEVFDDYSPEHITTEEDDINARIERMKYLQEKWSMVVGTEGGNDFSSSTIAFAHGIDIPPFAWIDEDMKDKNSEYYVGAYYSKTNGVPDMFSKQIPLKERVRKLFLDPTYTIPLYKLVYNDSVINTYWWGFGSLKFKDDIKERELYEVLYNVPPLYHIDKEEWEKHKEKITTHTKVWSGFNEKVINEEMTDFKILSEDKLVQMTEYGNKIKVIANFSNKERIACGEKIKEKSLIILDENNKTEYKP